MPTSADGSATALQEPILAFVAALERYGLPVCTVDESHTSREAIAGLKSARRSGARGRIAKPDVDAAAAVLIAERYLERHSGDMDVRPRSP